MCDVLRNLIDAVHLHAAIDARARVTRSPRCVAPATMKNYTRGVRTSKFDARDLIVGDDIGVEVMNRRNRDGPFLIASVTSWRASAAGPRRAGDDGASPTRAGGTRRRRWYAT